MSEARTGACQCGGIRYRLNAEPLFLAICHCRECQRQSGSAFGMSLTVPAHAFELLHGTLKTFTRASDSGRPLDCAFCPDCGVRIWHRPHYTTGVLNIRAGTLDDTAGLQPDAQFWTRSRQPWLRLDAVEPAFDAQPETP